MAVSAWNIHDVGFWTFCKPCLLAPALNVMHLRINPWESSGVLQGLTCSQLLRCSFPVSAHWSGDRSFKSESGSLRSKHQIFLAEKNPGWDADDLMHWGSGSGGSFCRWSSMAAMALVVLQPWFAGCCSWYELLLESQVLKADPKMMNYRSSFCLRTQCMDHFNTKLHRGECCIEERF